jgi:hypothetical protein
MVVVEFFIIIGFGKWSGDGWADRPADRYVDEYDKWIGGGGDVGVEVGFVFVSFLFTGFP